jgi:thiol-disulfide isomerase/thioredoxin
MQSSSTTSSRTRPRSSYRHLVWAGLFMLSGLCILIYLGSDRRRVIGQPVLDLDLPPLVHSKAGFKPEQAQGKLVLLHFWGPWCPPCRAEYPEILKLSDKYADGRLVRIASIASAATAPDDVPQLREDTLNFLGGDSLAGNASQHPVYCDPVEYSRIKIAKILGQRGFSYPTTILLDGRGFILDYWIRPTQPGELDRAIQTASGSSGNRL